MSKDKNLIEIAYNNLLAQGKVKNRAEFAKRLGINYISLSRAINNDGHYNTPSLREKIKQVFPTAEFEYQGESSPYPINKEFGGQCRGFGRGFDNLLS